MAELGPIACDSGKTSVYVLMERCGIHPIELARDGIKVTYFGLDPQGYIEVKLIREWHLRQLRMGENMRGSDKAVQACDKILADFEAGKIEFDGGSRSDDRQ